MNKARLYGQHRAENSMALELGSFKQARAGVTAAFFAMAPVAASFAGATLASLPSSSSASAQTVKKARVVVPAPRITPPPAPSTTGELRSIPKEHCDFLFDLADRTVAAEGEKYLSQTTQRSLAKFFAFGPDELPHCNGAAETRVIPWVTGTDYGFIMTLANFGTGHSKNLKLISASITASSPPCVPRCPAAFPWAALAVPELPPLQQNNIYPADGPEGAFRRA
jgi:hypothetical protein